MAVVGGEGAYGIIRPNTLDKPTSRYSLVGKKIAIDPDSSGHMKHVGIFNSIVTNEPVEVKKLFLNEFSARLGVVVWRAFNDNPSASGGGLEGMGRRIVTFEFKRISSNADPTLKTKLLEEVAGIFQWCWSMSKKEVIETFKNRGNIKSVANASIENLLDNNPHIRFLKETYSDSSIEIKASDLFEKYGSWCEEWNHGKLSQTKFGKELNKLHGLIEKEKRVAGFYYKIKAFKDFDLAVHFGMKNNAGSTMHKTSTMHPNPSCPKRGEAKESPKAMHGMNSSFNKKDSIKENKKDIKKGFIQQTMQTLQPSTIGSGWDVGSEEDDPHWD
jgi:phage/plasmid-associated DNA primase